MLRKTITTLSITALMVTGALGITMAQDENPDAPQRPSLTQKLEHRAERLAELAEVFGMTADEITAYLEAGGTIQELAEEQGVDLEALRAERQAERQQRAIDRINQAVEDGEITQAQADEIIERIENGEGFGRGNRPGRGRGNGFGFNFGNPDNVPDTPADSNDA